MGGGSSVQKRRGPTKQPFSRRQFLSQAGLALAGTAVGVTGASLGDLGPAAAGAAAPAGGAPKRGGTLTISQSVDINTLHPWTGTLNVWKVTKTNIYDQLSYQDPVTFQVKPKLAKSFVWTENNTSLIVTLPSGVTFHNGEKLTAEDVKFTLDSIRDPKVGSWLRGFIAPIRDVQVLDATHVKIKTETIENQLIPAFTYVDIVPRSQGTDLAKKNPIGSGPYKFVEWVPNDRVTLERNPNYWNEARAGHVDKIILRPVTELQTRISQLLAGDVDLVYDFSLREVPRLRADKSVAVAVVPPADQMFVVYLNMRKPPFNKVEMRQAMGWALDRQGFIKNFLAGLGRPDNSPFTPQHWAHDPKTENAYSYNPDTVAKLLEKAGYPKGRGLTFSFLVPSGYPEFKEISTLLQATFASIGYRPAIEEVDIAQWAARLNQSRDFFACVDYPPRGSTDPALTYSAGLLFPPNPANVCGLTPDAIPGYVDELRKGATTLERGLRKAAYAKVQELWLDYLPGPILCHRSTAHGLRPYVREFVPHPAFQQSFADVWLAK
jgi:peptide/nickel transport system substrate-binding protein